MAESSTGAPWLATTECIMSIVSTSKRKLATGSRLSSSVWEYNFAACSGAHLIQDGQSDSSTKTAETSWLVAPYFAIALLTHCHTRNAFDSAHNDFNWKKFLISVIMIRLHKYLTSTLPIQTGTKSLALCPYRLVPSHWHCANTNWHQVTGTVPIQIGTKSLALCQYRRAPSHWHCANTDWYQVTGTVPTQTGTKSLTMCQYRLVPSHWHCANTNWHQVTGTVPIQTGTQSLALCQYRLAPGHWHCANTDLHFSTHLQFDSRLSHPLNIVQKPSCKVIRWLSWRPSSGQKGHSYKLWKNNTPKQVIISQSPGTICNINIHFTSNHRIPSYIWHENSDINSLTWLS